VQSVLLYPDGHNAIGFSKRLGMPRKLPEWLSEEELAYYVGEYSKPASGASPWEGGMNWYRTGDLNWVETARLEGKRLSQPCLFIAGEDDMIISTMFKGKDNVAAMLRAHCEQLHGVVMFPKRGHWIQCEEAEAVTQSLLGFLRALPAPARAARL